MNQIFNSVQGDAFVGAKVSDMIQHESPSHKSLNAQMTKVAVAQEDQAVEEVKRLARERAASAVALQEEDRLARGENHSQQQGLALEQGFQLQKLMPKPEDPVQEQSKVLAMAPSLAGYWPISDIVGKIRRDKNFYLTLVTQPQFVEVQNELLDGRNPKEIKDGTISKIAQFVSFHGGKREKLYDELEPADKDTTGLYFKDIDCIVSTEFVTNAIYNANRNLLNPKQIGLYSAGIAERNLFINASLILHNYNIPIDVAADKGVDTIRETQDIIPTLNDYNLIIASAGMEAILPSVICSVSYRPVLAVPSAVGYGWAERGESSILSQLYSNCMGMGVFNIDNISGACICAKRINDLINQKVLPKGDAELTRDEMNELSFTSANITDNKEFYMQLRQIIPNDEAYKIDQLKPIWKDLLYATREKNYATGSYETLRINRVRLFEELRVKILVSEYDDMDTAEEVKMLLEFNNLHVEISKESINSMLVDTGKLDTTDIILVISSNPGLLANVVAGIYTNDRGELKDAKKAVNDEKSKMKEILNRSDNLSYTEHEREEKVAQAEEELAQAETALAQAEIEHFDYGPRVIITMPRTENSAKVMVQYCVAGIPVMPIDNAQATASFVSLIALKKLHINEFHGNNDTNLSGGKSKKKKNLIKKKLIE